MISVIVPVYKVEKYLNKCVQSILKQTYKDFELILVDDGSPDACPVLCEQYKKQDNRIRVIHKINGGLSDARNVGTRYAEGEWVTYIDSDDYVSEKYLEALWKLKEKYTADITVVGIETFLEGEKPKKTNRKKREYCYTGLEALENMLYQHFLDSSACAMLLPREMALSIPFPIGMFHEDEFTTYKYYASANKVAVSNEVNYYYLQRRGSIMHKSGQADQDELLAADNYVAFCEERYPALVPAANSKRFSDYCQVLLKAGSIRELKEEQYRRVCNYLIKNKGMIIRDRRARAKNRGAGFLLYFGVFFFYIIGKLLKKGLGKT